MAYLDKITRMIGATASICARLSPRPPCTVSIGATNDGASVDDAFVPSSSPSAPTSLEPSTSAACGLVANMRSHPRQIIVIRHAEKPDSDTDSGLSPRGQERASALAEALPRRYPHIDYLFASAPSPSSNRPVLTITPLAHKLQLPIDERFSDDQHKQLAQTLLTDPRYNNKTILICWHHGKIPQLAEDLGVTPPQNPWPSGTFDRIWQIDYNGQGVPTVHNLPQHVLPGDST